jgi:hypothetical protein
MLGYRKSAVRQRLFGITAYVIYFDRAIASAGENKLLMDLPPAGGAVEPSGRRLYHRGIHCS